MPMTNEPFGVSFFLERHGAQRLFCYCVVQFVLSCVYSIMQDYLTYFFLLFRASLARCQVAAFSEQGWDSATCFVFWFRASLARCQVAAFSELCLLTYPT